jgi:hypothetical protein
VLTPGWLLLAAEGEHAEANGTICRLKRNPGGPFKKPHRRKLNLTKHKTACQLMQLAAAPGYLGVIHRSIRWQGRGTLTATRWEAYRSVRNSA